MRKTKKNIKKLLILKCIKDMEKKKPSALWLSICEGMDREREMLRKKIALRQNLKALKALGCEEDEVEFKQ